MPSIRKINFRACAVTSLLVVWASLTFSIALTEIAFVGALVFWVLSKWVIVSNQRSVFNLPPAKIDRAFWAPLGIFFLLVLASFFMSEYPKQSLRGLYKIAKPLLAFIMVGDLFSDAVSHKRFNRTFLAVFLLVTIDCSIQYFFGKDLLRGFAAEYSSAGIRLVGPFGNFAKMSTYLVLVIPVFAMRFWKGFSCSDKRTRSFYDFVFALAGLALLYLTRCRGPVLALVFSLGILFVYKRWFKALGLGLFMFLVILAMVPREVIIHEDAQGKEQSLVERFELWKRALDVIEAKPWTGTGINTYDVAHAKYDKEQNWRVRGYYAHNGYLQLAAEIGLPGILSFLWFLFMLFRRSAQSLRRERGSPEEFDQLGLLAGLLAFLIYAIADNNLQSPPSLMMFWYLAGILVALQRKSVAS